jgi:hypothetical protein
MVLDRSGGKLSKTLYVRYGPDYVDLPEAFLNLDVLLDRHGEDTLEALWNEVERWATEPRRLHRSYTVDYLAPAAAHRRIPTQGGGQPAPTRTGATA